MNLRCGGVVAGGLACMLAALPLRARELPELPAVEVVQGGQMSDAWITTRIRAALVPVQRPGAVEVHVATHEGAVTLEGVVDDWITHDSVAALAARVRGVRSVDAQALRVGAVPVQ